MPVLVIKNFQSLPMPLQFQLNLVLANYLGEARILLICDFLDYLNANISQYNPVIFFKCPSFE